MQLLKLNNHFAFFLFLFEVVHDHLVFSVKGQLVSPDQKYFSYTEVDSRGCAGTWRQNKEIHMKV